MPRVRKRQVWVVSVFGGEWDDAWEQVQGVYADEAMAERAVANLKRRIDRTRDDDGIYDPVGADITEMFLVDKE